MTQNTSAQTKQIPTKKAECVSMTGYAQARAEANGWSIRISVKSVNHRFLDIKFRLPEGFDVYELRLRQIVREKIHRGHLDVNLNVQPGTAAPVQVNRDLLQAYLHAAEELRRQMNARSELDVVSLLRLPGVIGGLAPPLAGNRRRAGSARPRARRLSARSADQARRNAPRRRPPPGGRVAHRAWRASASKPKKCASWRSR